MNPILSEVLAVLAAAVLLFAALHDIGFRTIPDWVSVVLLAAGVALRIQNDQLPVSILCGLAVFVLAVLCWRRGWLGGGDVKLLGATAVLAPPAEVPALILAVALAGGILALLYLGLERVVPAPRFRRSASFPRRVLAAECRRIRRRASLPYAAAICAAALLMLVKD